MPFDRVVFKFFLEYFVLNYVLFFFFSLSTATPILHTSTMMFGCIHCEKSQMSSWSCSKDIETIYGHWLSAHTDPSNTKPFQFYVTQFVACYFCAATGTVHEMIEHQKAKHSNKSFVFVNETNRKQCALCNQFEELENHFERAHKTTISHGILNPFHVTDALLENILSIDIHKNVECGHCAVVFHTHHELEQHHSMTHPNVKIILNQFTDEKLMKLHCDQCNLTIHRDYFKHLEEHSFHFKCSECEFQTQLLAKLLAHNRQAHNNSTVKVQCDEFIRHLKEIHFKSKRIFSNGLVLTNFNLKITKFDESAKFETLLGELKERVNGLIQEKTESKEARRNNVKDYGESTSTGRCGGTKNTTRKHARMMSESDASEIDSDAFSISSETSIVSSNLSLSTSISSNETISRTQLYAELKKQNELVKNLSITGIPCLRHENLLNIFERMCIKINAPVAQRDVAKIFRTSGPHQPIIVKLKTWTAKANIKRCCLNKDLWSSDIVTLPGRMPSTRIFINLHTTRFYGKMVQIAKYYKTIGIIQSYHLCEKGLLVKCQHKRKDRTVLSKQELLNLVKDIKDGQFDRKFKRNQKSHNDLETNKHKIRRIH